MESAYLILVKAGWRTIEHHERISGTPELIAKDIASKASEAADEVAVYRMGQTHGTPVYRLRRHGEGGIWEAE